MRVAPILQVRRIAEPHIKAIAAAAIHGHRSLEPRELSVDLLGEENHVAVVGRGEREHAEGREVFRNRNAAAQAVMRVAREADIALAVDRNQSRVVNANQIAVGGADQILVIEPPDGLGLNLPANAVATKCQAEVCGFEFRIHPLANVIAEEHDVLAAKLADPGIEDERGRVGNLLPRERGRRMSLDAGGGFEISVGHWCVSVKIFACVLSASGYRVFCQTSTAPSFNNCCRSDSYGTR